MTSSTTTAANRATMSIRGIRTKRSSSHDASHTRWVKVMGGSGGNGEEEDELTTTMADENEDDAESSVVARVRCAAMGVDDDDGSDGDLRFCISIVDLGVRISAETSAVGTCNMAPSSTDADDAADDEDVDDADEDDEPI
jgi:hypothetical protein